MTKLTQEEREKMLGNMILASSCESIIIGNKSGVGDAAKKIAAVLSIIYLTMETLKTLQDTLSQATLIDMIFSACSNGTVVVTPEKYEQVDKLLKSNYEAGLQEVRKMEREEIEQQVDRLISHMDGTMIYLNDFYDLITARNENNSK